MRLTDRPPRFIVTSARFLWRVTKRSIGAIVLVLLKFSEVYQGLLRPHVPASWHGLTDSLMNVLATATWGVAVLIVIGACLYTYYELDAEVRRDPRIREELGRLYERSDRLLRTPVNSEIDLEAVRLAIDIHVKKILGWVDANMGPAAQARVRHATMLLPYSPPVKSFNDQHQQLLNGLNMIHENLKGLIESDEWR